MGKAARNEARKLLATFCNNVSVGLVLGGLLLPLIYLLYTKSQGAISFSNETYWAVGGMIASFGCALAAQYFAYKELEKIED